MTTSPRRWAALPVLALAAIVGLTGCIDPRQFLPEIDSSPEPLTSTDEYFEQKLDWTTCGAMVECATVVAPLDWQNPNSGAIKLAVAKARATGTAQGSLLVNPGGPGASGFEFVRDGVDYFASSALRENFDIVGWDPRGVGRSSQVTCLDDDDKDDLIYGEWNSDYESAGWIDEIEAAEQKFVDACVANTGPLLEYVDSVSTAHDMNLLRALLGDEKLTYLGFSYGTYFGTVFAELFPERVGRLVLDGALDPTMEPVEWFEQQMAGFDGAMVAYLEFCVSSGDCIFKGGADRAATQFAEFVEAVDARELTTSDGRVLDSATLGSAIAAALYSQDAWPGLSFALASAAQGDPEPAFELADSYYGRDSDGSYGDNSFEVYTATLCLDNDFQGDGIDTARGLELINEAAPLVGRTFVYDDYGHVETACSLWPHRGGVGPEQFDAAGAPPILVIGTTNDPATPYVWAQALAEQLESGVLVTFNGEGHTAYGRDSCIIETVDDYLIDGVVPAADPNC